MAARKIRVGIIFGGRSQEHDVSITSANAIINAIDRRRFEAIPIGITRQGQWLTGGDPLMKLAETSRIPLPKRSGEDANPDGESDPGARGELSVRDSSDASWVQNFDVVFPVLHGPMGEDGTIQGMLELAGIPYVGSGVLGSAVAMDKITAKRLFEQTGLPLGPWLGIIRSDWQRNPAAIAERIARKIGFPCFVKPSNLGSSVGVSKVHESGELAQGIEAAASFDRRILVESAIDARELEVSVLGNDKPMSSVVGEIVPSEEFYSYEAKYLDDRSELFVPADIPPQISDKVRRIAVEAFQILDCCGMARVDFFLERRTGEVLLNEINTIPGFTPISMYPKLWEASGLPFSELVTRLIELAIERYDEQAIRE